MKQDYSSKKPVVIMSQHTFLYALRCAQENTHEATILGCYTEDTDGAIGTQMLNELIEDGDVILGEI